MAAKHTPGPWVGKLDADDWDVSGPTGGICMTYEAIGAPGRAYPIAFVVQCARRAYRDGDAELSANVGLILAAPLMRKALLAVRAACRDPDTDTALPSAVGEAVEAALAAMGERS